MGQYLPMDRQALVRHIPLKAVLRLTSQEVWSQGKLDRKHIHVPNVWTAN